MKAARAVAKDIDSYLAGFAGEVRERLEAMRETIRAAAPGATECIKYQIPTFVLGENLVHFAAFKNHVGFYPTGSGMRKFAKELSRYVSGKGSVQFPHDEPLPLKLVARITAFRVKESQGRKSG